MSSLRAKIDRRRGIAEKPPRSTSGSEEEAAKEEEDEEEVLHEDANEDHPAEPQQQQQQQQQYAHHDQEQSDSEIHLEDDPEDLVVDEEDHGDSSGQDEPLPNKKSTAKKNAPAKPKAPPKKPPTKKKAPKEEIEYAEPSSSEEEVEEDPKDDDDYHESSEEEEDSEEDEDSDDDEDFGVSRKRKAPAKKKKAPPRSRAAAAKKKKASPPARASTRKKARLKDSSSEEEQHDDDEDDESSEDFGAPKRRGRNVANRRSSPRNRQRPTRSIYKDVGSSGEEEESNNDEDSDESEGRARPSRASAAKATAKIHQMNYKEEQEDDSEEEEPPARKPKSRAKDSDDEEFQVDEDKEQEEEDEELEDANSEDSFTNGVASVKSDHQNAGNVEMSDFGEDDLSETERRAKGKAKKPQRSRRKAAAKQKKEEYYSDSDDDDNESGKRPARKRRAAAKPDAVKYYSDSDDNEEEDEISPTKAGREKNSRKKSTSSPPKLPACPSKTDEITTDALPERHVCFFSPDGQSRQCFCLETLHKIAMVTAHPQYRTNISGEQQRTFLQPPHFRSAMSDDLLDQIASRFGRQALDLNGEFYNRSKGPVKVPANDDEDEDECHLYQVTFEGALADEEEFLDTLRNYQLNKMGSQDIYPCPVCYTVAHHRLSSADRKEKIVPPSEFKYDPITVLGSLDDDDFQVASAICFKKISEVKVHLKEDHNVDVSLVGDSGLWYKFKVRTQDGLLQRFLSKSRTYGKTKQGDMRRYWYDGNSECFIYLLHQMERMRIYRNLLKAQGDDGGSDEDEEDEDHMDPLRGAKDFFRSFADQANDLWETLVGPYSKQAQDVSDFIANPGDEEEESGDDEQPHVVFDQEEAQAEKDEDKALAAHYEQMARERSEKKKEQASDGQESSDYEDEEDLDEQQQQQQQQQSSDSEEDEWVQGIRNKQRRKNSLEPKEVANGNGRKKIAKSKNDDDYDSDLSPEPAKNNFKAGKAPPSAQRAVLDDSD